MGVDSRTSLAHLLKEIDGFTWPSSSSYATCQYDGVVKFSNDFYAVNESPFITLPFIDGVDVVVNPTRLLPSYHSCSKSEFHSI